MSTNLWALSGFIYVTWNIDNGLSDIVLWCDDIQYDSPMSMSDYSLYLPLVHNYQYLHVTIHLPSNFCCHNKEYPKVLLRIIECKQRNGTCYRRLCRFVYITVETFEPSLYARWQGAATDEWIKEV
jgi:hypothetical protein